MHRLALISFLMTAVIVVSPYEAQAQCQCSQCQQDCIQVSSKEKDKTKEHITKEFKEHRKWLVDEVFQKHLLPALMLFAEQITAMSMQQMSMVGAFLDAKHQMETQRLLQQMMAEAHKDYQPSEGMCVFGTNVRSLAASDRNTELTAMGLSNRVLQRELLSGNGVAGGGRSTDFKSRIRQFVELYCNQDDNGKGLKMACSKQSAQPERVNNDINYTAVMETPLTLKLDFTSAGDQDHQDNKHAQTLSTDEEDVFALSANLYAHNVAPTIPPAFLTDEDGQVNERGASKYMDIRAIAAKRSVARNSFAEIAAMKSQGKEEVQPYMYAILKEFGLKEEDEIPKYLGKKPSYYAQMEVLTKKLYQNPTFYAELYDKPANVARKTVAMQAINLMQRRDMYRSVLRSEAILSVMLETALSDRQDRIVNEFSRMSADGELVQLP